MKIIMFDERIYEITDTDHEELISCMNVSPSSTASDPRGKLKYIAENYTPILEIDDTFILTVCHDCSNSDDFIEKESKRAFIAGYKRAMEYIEQKDKDIIVDFYTEYWNKK